MATRYPATGIDDGTTLPNPSASNPTNSPSHSAQHANVNDAVKAVETKLGTGASTPTSNTLLLGTGTGTSAWTQATSAQLAAAISDETGTGKAVFATSPTLITPAVDTINESTPSNGVTVGGVNLKSGVVGANSVGTSSAQTNAIQANQLATSAITLGYAQITANAATTSTTAVQVAGLSATVTIPAGGRRIKITAFGSDVYVVGSVNIGALLTIWDGVVGSGTQLARGIGGYNSGSYAPVVIAMAVVTPSAGSKTYNVGLSTQAAGTANIEAGATYPAFILVEAI